jgi:hypothetical protein
MDDLRKGILRDWNAGAHEIRDVLEDAVREALREHKLAGRSVVVWDRRNDRIVNLPADQIELPEDRTAPKD